MIPIKLLTKVDKFALHFLSSAVVVCKLSLYKVLLENHLYTGSDLVQYIFHHLHKSDYSLLKRMNTKICITLLNNLIFLRTHPGISFNPLYFSFFIVQTLFTQSMLKVVSPFGNLWFAVQIAVQTAPVHFKELAAGALGKGVHCWPGLWLNKY